MTHRGAARNRWQIVRRIGVVAVLAVSAVFTAPRPTVAQAGAGTCGTIGTQYGAMVAYSNSYDDPQFYGVTSDMTFEPTSLCTTVDGDSNASESYDGLVSNDTHGWSESGKTYWVNDLGSGDSCETHFADQDENDEYFAQDYWINDACVTDGDTYQERQQMDTSTGEVSAIIANDTVLTTSYDVLSAEGSASGSGWGTAPFQLWFAGRTNYEETYVPGSSTTPVPFTEIQYEDSSGDYDGACTNIVDSGADDQWDWVYSYSDYYAYLNTCQATGLYDTRA